MIFFRRQHSLQPSGPRQSTSASRRALENAGSNIWRLLSQRAGEIAQRSLALFVALGELAEHARKKSKLSMHFEIKFARLPSTTFAPSASNGRDLPDLGRGDIGPRHNSV